MKLLLCSEYYYTASNFLKKFFNLKERHTCLFVGYANEENDFSSKDSLAAKKLKEQNFEIIDIDENYEFNDKIDLIFVRGGNTTKLLHLLHKFNQFEKIRKMIENDVVFVGQSAGAILAGTDTSWTLESEPYEFDLINEFGKNALNGYGFVNKLIFVHCSRYRMCRDYEMKNENDIFRTLDTDCYFAYRQDLKKFSKDKFIRIGNNEAFYVNGDDKKILKFNWSKIPVKIIENSK